MSISQSKYATILNITEHILRCRSKKDNTLFLMRTFSFAGLNWEVPKWKHQSETCWCPHLNHPRGCRASFLRQMLKVSDQFCDKNTIYIYIYTFFSFWYWDELKMKSVAFKVNYRLWSFSCLFICKWNISTNHKTFFSTLFKIFYGFKIYEWIWEVNAFLIHKYLDGKRMVMLKEH